MSDRVDRPERGCERLRRRHRAPRGGPGVLKRAGQGRPGLRGAQLQLGSGGGTTRAHLRAGRPAGIVAVRS